MTLFLWSFLILDKNVWSPLRLDLSEAFSTSVDKTRLKFPCSTFPRHETGKVVWLLSFDHVRIRINTAFRYPNATFSWQNQVIKVCPKYLLSFYQNWSSQYKRQINVAQTKSTDVHNYPGYKYKSGRVSSTCTEPYLEPRTTWPRGLVVSMAGYVTRGLGSIPGCAPIFSVVFFSFIFSILMLTQVNRMSKSRRVLATGGKQRSFGLHMVCFEMVLYHIKPHLGIKSTYKP